LPKSTCTSLPGSPSATGTVAHLRPEVLDRSGPHGCGASWEAVAAQDEQLKQATGALRTPDGSTSSGAGDTSAVFTNCILCVILFVATQGMIAISRMRAQL
jgi:hypothetical protein